MLKDIWFARWCGIQDSYIRKTVKVMQLSKMHAQNVAKTLKQQRNWPNLDREEKLKALCLSPTYTLPRALLHNNQHCLVVYTDNFGALKLKSVAKHTP